MCEAPCGFRLRCTLDRGRHTPDAPSRLRDKATAAALDSIHTAMCLCSWHSTARSGQGPAAHGWASGMTGQYRDRTVHMGTMPARCFDFVGFVFVFLFCFLESLPAPRGGSCWTGLVGLWFPLLKAHMARGSQQDGRRQPGRYESSGQRWQRRGEGRRDKAKHRR